MSKENIINLISFNIVKPRLSPALSLALSLAPVLLHSLTPNLNLTQPKRVHFSSLELDTIVIRLVSPCFHPALHAFTCIYVHVFTHNYMGLHVLTCVYMHLHVSFTPTL